MSVLHAPDHQPTPTDVFECLTEPRRRDALATLVAVDRSITEEDLAAHLADEREGRSDAETTRAALRHVDLPKLAALDLVAWDTAEETVALGTHPLTDDDRFRRLLAAGDDRWAVATTVHGDECRRAVVETLSADGDRTTRDDLAAHLAEDAELPAERLAVQLHHVHLPKLADVGLLAYDETDGTVVPGDVDVPQFDHAVDAN